MLIVILAALAMVVQDIFGTLMVQAEARNRGWLAGCFDSLMWLAAISTTTISVTSLQGHDEARKVAVILAVTAANITGSRLGVFIGERLVKADPVICSCSNCVPVAIAGKLAKPRDTG